MSGAVKPATQVQRALAVVADAWSRLWFQDRSTLPLELSRVGIGAALLINYGLATRYFFELSSESAWIAQAAIGGPVDDPWQQSIFFYLTSSWQLLACHYIFLLSCAAFMLGWRTSWVKWIVLVGEISYAHYNVILTYGVDRILCSLLVILCLAPIGRALSVDRVREVRAAKREDVTAVPAPYRSPWAGACIRLMQIQMATLFFYSAVYKLHGDDWLNGNAVWIVFSHANFYNPFLLNLFASHYWLVNVATYGTLLIEIAFPFLIWQRATRPYLLAAAIFLHLQIALFMGMPYFSFVMIMGHMSFVRPEWLAALGQAWKRKIGPMEMIYDGHCGFCRRSMAWLLAFDGLRQIHIRDYRTNPSPVVRSELVDRALYLVRPDARALPGFDAYRCVVARVPGLWWLIPFFFVPVFSRLFGRPLYDWVAANRGRLSSWTHVPRLPQASR